MRSPHEIVTTAREKLQQKRIVTTRALSSRENFVSAIEIDETAHGRSEERSFWKNEDLDLTPRAQWTWGWHDFAAFWWSYGFSVGGMYGSFFPITIRLLVGQIWNSVLMMQGGYFLSILLRCIFGSAWHDLKNTIPKSQGITVQQLVAFILYTLITAPLLLLRPSHMRRLYTTKSVVLPPVAIGLFAFCIIQGRSASGSAGSFKTSFKLPLNGTGLAWVMLSAINSCMGKMSSIAVNQTDLARYARSPNTPVWSQLLSLPIGNTLCAALGIFASCMGVDVFPFSVDVTSFFPRWINIRRGMYLCYIIGLLIFPWKILQSSTTSLRFLGGYSVFFGAPCGDLYFGLLGCEEVEHLHRLLIRNGEWE
ncbi:permease for cytosine/purines, uracil, thiamine, allantoin-domain-containing protein [Clohesyomyces aquaticus]|uniref:Permease for cytosine/purines, uracil, thiamine, allantoin-domain-containing protein n=1 Tax=Clohesyomyces aquaticus TaxID=1231657 RepID=A0A1Y1YTV5_9PLEO|nr:permease for cytosine/purines, uracil, thiamine, allantoin-domain-containing protein [Clohesyomyces aquaticus]